MAYYNRYNKFLVDGQTRILPFIKIPSKPTDRSIIWKRGVSRLDVISNKNYNTPYGGWLIMLANGMSGIDEFDIEDGVQLIIPFPYKDSLQQYIEQVDRYIRRYSDNV